MSSSHIMAIDLKNLQANASNYKVISFPKRIKITEISFSVNGEAAGAVELARVWKLYALGAHPTPTLLNPWSEWTSEVFVNTQKPILENATSSFYSTIEAPASVLIPTPNGGGILNLELNGGVFAPNDYLAIWVQNDSGDVSTITWENTEATINIVYEETAMKTLYEQVQANPWLD